MARWEKTAQYEWKYQQAIVPERPDVVFLQRLADKCRSIVQFITKRPLPNLQQAKTESDEPTRQATFDFQFPGFSAEAGQR